MIEFLECTQLQLIELRGAISREVFLHEVFVPHPYAIIDLPSFRADPARHGTRTGTFIVLNLAERVILIGDGDTAGRTMVATLAHNMANAVRRPMPEGEDVTSFVVANGADAFLSYLTDKDRS